MQEESNCTVAVLTAITRPTIATHCNLPPSLNQEVPRQYHGPPHPRDKYELRIFHPRPPPPPLCRRRYHHYHTLSPPPSRPHYYHRRPESSPSKSRVFRSAHTPVVVSIPSYAPSQTRFSRTPSHHHVYTLLPQTLDITPFSPCNLVVRPCQTQAAPLTVPYSSTPPPF